MEHWEEALSQFLENWKRNPSVVGALVCGSFVTGNPSPNSDIDLHLILSPETEWRQRGNRVIDGMVIEYFANPPAQIREYFSEDYQDRTRMAATQFVTGCILFDRMGCVAALKQEAEEWHRKPFPKLDKISIELMKYSLWDRLDDLQDAVKRDAPDLVFVYYHMIQRIYSDYARFLGEPVIGFAKLTRCLFDPEQAMQKYRLNPFPDAEFLVNFKQAMEETDRASMPVHAEKLTNYLLDKLGGFKLDGWEFRSPAKCESGD
jgi:hypothetical protein